jgi:hypothetical protein
MLKFNSSTPLVYPILASCMILLCAPSSHALPLRPASSSTDAEPDATPDRCRVAIVSGEPGSCNPPCGAGSQCKKGKCISLCKPACKEGFRCDKDGACVPTGKLKGRPNNYRFIGLTAGIRIGLSNPAATQADIRAEIAGKYLAFQAGFNIGDSTTTIRAAVIGHYYFQPKPNLPLFIAPRVGLGYAFNWVDTPDSLKLQDFLIAFGVRVRYDIHYRVALLFDPLQFDVGYLRLRSRDNVSLGRIGDIPVNLSIRAGIAIAY